MVQAVIFDVDGTLVDSVDLHAMAWRDAFEDFGHHVDLAEIRGQIGKGGDHLMPMFIERDELEEKGERIEKHRAGILKERYLGRITGFADVRALFERILADGKKIALASSAKDDELDRYKKIAGIDDLIDAQTSSDDAKSSKPDPDIFQAAVARLEKIPPSDIIVVGDTPYDAEAAAKAGMKTIGMLCGGFPEEALRQAGCIAIYDSPRHLLAEYDQSPLAGKSPGE